jgi:phosphatidylserine/phosphatidylglycerophosphate/cardiolipin synthase-like enzyme
VDVAIARTFPELNGRQEIREVEALYLEAIGRAERTIYIETQYLASRKIADALAQRLSEPEGPEIVIILPESIEGWLEHKAMDGARLRLLHLLWRADLHKRFGVFYPVTSNGTPIYVHAKVMVIDDKLLRVGSSNLNNRSMGFDSECDLAIEAVPGASDYDRLSGAILSVRRDLLCEHLGVDKKVFSHAMDDGSGSVLATIKRFSVSGRTLKPLDLAAVADDESALAENELLDPERPAQSPRQRLADGLSDTLAKFSLRRAQ